MHFVHVLPVLLTLTAGAVQAQTSSPPERLIDEAERLERDIDALPEARSVERLQQVERALNLRDLYAEVLRDLDTVEPRNIWDNLQRITELETIRSELCLRITVSTCVLTEVSDLLRDASEDERWAASRSFAVAQARSGRIPEAVQTAYAIGDQRATPLGEIAAILARTGEAIRATWLADLVPTEARSTVLLPAAQVVASTGNITALDHIIAAVGPMRGLRGALGAGDILAGALAAGGRFEDARRIAEGIRAPGTLAAALAAIAEAEHRAGREEAARETLRRAESLAMAIQSEGMRNEALARLAPALAVVGQIARARDLAQGILSDSYRAMALAAVASVLARNGDQPGAEVLLTQARAAAEDTEFWQARQRATRSIITAEVTAGRFSEALNLTTQRDRENSERTRRAIVVVLLGRNQPDEAERMARGNEPSATDPIALATVAAHQARAGQDDAAQALFAEARTLARNLGKFGPRAEALAEIAALLAEAGR